jgi:hypothetical protein
MKASELRIGNLVYCPIMDGINKNDIYKVKVIFDDAVKIDIGLNAIQQLSLNGVKGSDVNPIKLTEDIVIDLGLKPVELENGEWFYQDSKFRLNKNYSGFYYSKNLGIKYVHQLQNLYFALTNEELKLD